MTVDERVKWIMNTTLATAWINMKTVHLLRSGMPEESARAQAEREYHEKLRGGRGRELAAELSEWFKPS